MTVLYGNEEASASTGVYYSVSVTTHKVTYNEIEAMKSEIGVYQEGTDYNVIVDGHGTGLAPPTEEQWAELVGNMNIVDEISLDIDGPMPTSLDLSTSKYFPPIGNQDGEGSCVAWATGYYTKTFQEASEHDWDLSGAVWEGGYYGYPSSDYQDMIFSPDFIYHQINNGKNNGAAYVDAFALISNIGVCTWENMPNNATEWTSWPSEAAWREAPLYRGDSEGEKAGYNYVSLTGGVQDLKNLLLSGNLGVISINANYYSELTANDVWTTDNYDPSGTNHANTVVGYDDSFAYVEGGVVKYGAFKVANSWGTGWSGDHNGDGYYWISYEAMRTEVGYFMYTNDLIDYNPTAVAVFEIEHDRRNECEIAFGTGDTEDPTAYKEFAPYYLSGGAYPFPDNKIVVDITELYPNDEDIFIEIYDRELSATTETGVLNSFSVEEYSVYNEEGNADNVLVSLDTPLNTEDNTYVYAVYPRTLLEPLLNAPVDTSTMGLISPTFSWDEVRYAGGYVVEVATDPATGESGGFLPENIVYEGLVDGPSKNRFVNPDYDFAEGVLYYWHVKATRTGGDEGPWSETWSISMIPGITYFYTAGWSLYSFPYLPSSLDLDTLLAGLEEDIDYVYRWNSEEGRYEYSQYIEGYGWIGDFNTVDDEHGYWFHSVGGTSMLHEDDGTALAGSIALKEGWNLVSWPRKEKASLDDVLLGISGTVDYVYRWNAFLEKYEYSQYIEGYGWIGDFTALTPGYGYWMHCTGDCVWNII